MKATIKAYLKETKIVGINGKSLGEAPHYFLQIIFPIYKEVYISDTNKDLYNGILVSLFKENIISSTNYNIEETQGGILEISRNLFI